MSDGAGWVRITTADLPTGEMRAVEVGRTSVAVFHLDDGSWHAIGNECTHQYALLTDGWLEGSEIECPLHAAKFDVRTGQAFVRPGRHAGAGLPGADRRRRGDDPVAARLEVARARDVDTSRARAKNY